MNNIFRGLIAGYGAKKLGGGCFSMVLIFIIIWVALGQCENGSFGERRRQREQLNKQVNEFASLMNTKKISIIAVPVAIKNKQK